MNHLERLTRIARPTHTCRVWFHVLRILMPHKHVDISAANAVTLIRQIHCPQVKSCVMNNRVASAPQYDLMLIIATYNGGAALQQCVGSIVSQPTKYKLHVVVVDDCSTDGSVEALKRECKDERVEYLAMKVNSGVSAARNAALHDIDSRYIGFVDADDVLPRGTIDKWLDRAYAADADVVEGSMVVTDGDKRSLLVSHDDGCDVNRLTGYACGKVFSARLFEHVGFPEGVRYEDTLLSFVLYRLADKVATLSDVTYEYSRHEGSFTSREHGNPASLDAYWVVRQLLDDLHTLHIPHDQALYDAFLMGMKLSANRLDAVGGGVCEAYFAAMIELAQEFNAMRSHKLKYVDEAIRKSDFTLYRLASYLL